MDLCQPAPVFSCLPCSSFYCTRRDCVFVQAGEIKSFINSHRIVRKNFNPLVLCSREKRNIFFFCLLRRTYFYTAVCNQLPHLGFPRSDQPPCWLPPPTLHPWVQLCVSEPVTRGAAALPGGLCPLTSVSDVTACLSSLSLSVTDLGQRSLSNEVNMQLLLMTALGRNTSCFFPPNPHRPRKLLKNYRCYQNRVNVSSAHINSPQQYTVKVDLHGW